MNDQVPAYTAEQVRSAERPLLEAGAPLMRRAAAALAEIVRSELEGREPGPSAAPHRTLEPVVRQSPDAALPRVLVLAGSGDNGGDALFAAALLTGAADVDVLLVADRFHQAALSAAVGAGARRVDLPEVADTIEHYALVIDGIVGIGASHDATLRGTARDVVAELLTLREERGWMPRILAVDIPSGLHPDSGEADDAVLPADMTVTFGALKAGLVTGRGPELSGDIVLVDLGLGAHLGAQRPADAAEPTRPDHPRDVPAVRGGGVGTVARVVTAPDVTG